MEQHAGLERCERYPEDNSGCCGGSGVDFPTSTVITSDLNFEEDEVGVLKSIAKNLTYPEQGISLGHSGTPGP